MNLRDIVSRYLIPEYTWNIYRREMISWCSLFLEFIWLLCWSVLEYGESNHGHQYTELLTLN